MNFAEYAPDAHGAPLEDVVVRPASVSDVPGCAALLALRDGGAATDWSDRLEYWLVTGQQVFVAELHGEIIGYARLSWQTPVTNGGHNAPDGYYLSGIIVHPRYRRRGIGRALTRARCDWTREQGERTYFVVNAANRASMDLHRELGFRELTRDFAFPGVTFSGSEGGVLFGVDPSRDRQQVTQLRMRAAG